MNAHQNTETGDILVLKDLKNEICYKWRVIYF